ncbi:MAG TPA: hypothetical protein VMU84_16715, partial [Thermoanaerobaculia bacterium]|nr:hypothetical protein [Thermoanaerobaculia bacterium]
MPELQQPAVVIDVPPAPESWPLAKRILFRFAFAYFFLYTFPFPFDFTGFFFNIWDTPVQLVAKWIGADAAVKPNGSGDTTYNFVQLIVFAALALLITIAWSVIDRKRTRYDRAYVLFRMLLRFSLAAAMVRYGIAKVVPSQFPAPTLDRLLQTYGDSSPMGLLWTFMGASRVYSFFGGAGELTGGLLLTTRRTSLLGALISAAVMLNVAVLNFAYDVPVKLYSSHLLLMALIIALPDAKRLVDFFVLHRPIAPAPLPRLTRWRWTVVLGVVVRTLIVAYVVVTGFQQTLTFSRRYNSVAERPQIYGIWAIDKSASTGESLQWSRIVFDNKGWMGVMLDGNSRRRLWTAYATQNAIGVTKRDDPTWKGRVTYAQPDDHTLVLDGTWGGQPIHIVAHREPIPHFLLTSRGFHWINEYP